MNGTTSKKSVTSNVLWYILFAILAVICIIPFYNIFINATYDSATIASSYKLYPGRFLASNYKTLITYVNIWRAMFNSAVIAVSCTVLSSYFGALAAYGFAKFHFRYNNELFWVLLATMMLPAQLGIIGYFQLMGSFHLLDNQLSLIIPSIANASAVFFIKQYLQGSLPNSIIESGRIDGCGELKIFHRIVFPIITPAVFTQAIFIFVSSWNNFINPLILLFSPAKLTLPVVIQQMTGTYSKNYGVVYLGISISVIPILLVFSIFSKRIIGNLAVGAVKG